MNSSRECYNLKGWSDGYFDCNEQGNLSVCAQFGEKRVEVDLHALTHEIRGRGLHWPVLIRCTNILHDRIDQLCNSFSTARAAHAYQGAYTAIYPIKVNQQFSVVNEILKHGGTRVGLEVGSKPELMAVLGLAKPDCTIVCNGYKDREYIRLALIAAKLGQRIYPVIEKLSELDVLLEEIDKLQIKPQIGVRVRLASIGEGKWQNSGGEHSKFGLHATQLLELVERLRSAGLLNRLHLLHFHLGSQLTNLQDLKNGLAEGARFYSELRQLGAPIQVVDAGGGLGVDYEGTRTRNYCSMNYSIDQYADAVVEAMQQICVENNLPNPQLFTESGRAMTAHHAVLVTNVIDTERSSDSMPDLIIGEGLPYRVSRLVRLCTDESGEDPEELWKSLDVAMQEVQKCYAAGEISLKHRSIAEQAYFYALKKIQAALNGESVTSKSLLKILRKKLADKYFCNLSIFQSLPDIWAIDQIFPIVPLSRLNEEPDRNVIIEDVTCDSDGRIDRYVEGKGIEHSLRVHSLRPGEDYLLGIFMVGAYQEILGDMHNLFGDTNTVNLEIKAGGSYELTQHELGDRAEEVLRYVHFSPEKLRSCYQRRVNEAELSNEEAKLCLDELTAGLKAYTYPVCC